MDLSSFTTKNFSNFLIESVSYLDETRRVFQLQIIFNTHVGKIFSFYLPNGKRFLSSNEKYPFQSFPFDFFGSFGFITREKSKRGKNSFSSPLHPLWTIANEPIPKNCQGSHERTDILHSIAFNFPGLNRSSSTSVAFISIPPLSLLSSPRPRRRSSFNTESSNREIIPSSHRRGGVGSRTISRKFRAKHFGDT